MSLWRAEMPSNIALIKYMGKNPFDVNWPTNPSISLTLDHLKTCVEIEPHSGKDEWQPLNEGGYQAPELSQKGRERFLKHFSLLKSHWGVDGHFIIRSGNNFPSDCGLASSASSFAALTKASYLMAQDQVGADETILSLANLSRKGSGSSCRSFLGPFCEWDQDQILAVDFGFTDLNHKVVIIEDKMKAVSSSEAHKRVQSSLNFNQRTERAVLRLVQLKKDLQDRNWQNVFETCWAEFWDMHCLFETSNPSFGYMTSESLNVLHKIRQYWVQYGDGPIVTMDAGANIHLIRVSEDFLNSGVLNGCRVI